MNSASPVIEMTQACLDDSSISRHEIDAKKDDQREQSIQFKSFTITEF